MVDVSGISGWNSSALITLLVTAVVALVAIVIMIIGVKRDWYITGPLFLGTLCLVGFGVFIASGAGQTQYQNEVRQSTIEQIEAEGYSDVVLSAGGRSFVANRNGEFVKGFLSRVGDRQYVIYEGVRSER